ncbi:hypothetical protein AX16_006497 [Volvariella volvacea WC 439]|nr:hypothetical protein AX16_006497 [Volvariella volvacea WC 439]
MHPIYNGRPNTRSSHHDYVFATINLSQIESDQHLVGVTVKLFERPNGIDRFEDGCGVNIRDMPQNLLDIEFNMYAKAQKADGGLVTESDTIATISLGSGVKAIHTHVELKTKLGVRGNSGFQGTSTLRKQQISDSYQEIQQASHCPRILISVAGPYICSSGSIFVDVFVTRPFTDYIHLGGDTYMTKRIYHLAQPARPRSSLSTRHILIKQLSNSPSDSDLLGDDTSYNRSLFIAELDDELCLKSAPRLRFVSKLRGAVKVVVMDIAEGTPADDAFLKKSLPGSVIESLTRAIRALHDQNYVMAIFVDRTL